MSESKPPLFFNFFLHFFQKIPLSASKLQFPYKISISIPFWDFRGEIAVLRGDIQPPLDLPGGWPPHLQTYVMWGLASLIQGYNCVGVKLY